MINELPSDLRSVLSDKAGVLDAVMSISASGISISTAALALIGDPSKVDVQFSPSSRMIAVVPSAPRGRRPMTVSVSKKAIAFSAKQLARLGFNPEQGRSTNLPVTLVSGVLLAGPVPANDGE